jgi:glycosyltransferase involved in cell wall biosynthesis
MLPTQRHATWAVVPTKNRPDVVRGLLKSLVGQVDHFIVVDNNDTPDDYSDVHPDWITRIHCPGYPPNLSQLYNVGMDAADDAVKPFRRDWNLVLLNDDVVCPPGWVTSLETAMRATTAVMAYTDRLGRSEPVLYTTPPTTPYETCMVAACMLRGERGIRFDESFHWWYGDTDLDYRCRQDGGVLAVPGKMPDHLHPSAQTFSDAVLSARTHVDREVFDRKWNGVPW